MGYAADFGFICVPDEIKTILSTIVTNTVEN